MERYNKHRRLRLILSIWLMLLSTIFFSIVFVFGAYQTDTEGGLFNVEYINSVEFTASNFNSKMKTISPTKIVFDYDNSSYNTIKDNSQKIEVYDYLNADNVMQYAYVYLYNNTEVYVLSESEIYAPTSCSGLFRNLKSLQSISFSNFNTSMVTDMSSMFYMEPYETGKSSLTTLNYLTNFNTSNVTKMTGMFTGCLKLTILNLSNFDTKNIINMRRMFGYCSGLTSLTFGSEFKTDNVTEMDNMFENCSSLTSLDVSKFNTSKVTDMSTMFSGCSSLTNLNLSSFNTTNVTDVQFMFYGCSSLVTLTLGQNFKIGDKVEYTRYMFYQCSKLSGTLDLSKFNPINVVYMEYMFYQCSSLTVIDLSGWTSCGKVKYVSYIFYDCSNLKTIYCNLDLTSAVNSNNNNDSANLTANASCVINNCNNLVGGDGSAYSKHGGDYADLHPDEGCTIVLGIHFGNHGYFTKK